MFGRRKLIEPQERCLLRGADAAVFLIHDIGEFGTNAHRVVGGES